MTSVSQSEARTQRALVKLRVAIEIIVWRHGWLWVLATVVLFVAFCMALLGRLSIDQQTAQLRKEEQTLARLEADAVRRKAVGAVTSGGDGLEAETNVQRRAALETVLVPRGMADEQVRLIYKLAADHQVSILQADFGAGADGDGIDRMHIAIPTKANYPQLRRFIEAALRALPNASLDRLSFKRTRVGDTQVEARVHLSLWLQPQSKNRAGFTPNVGTSKERP